MSRSLAFAASLLVLMAAAAMAQPQQPATIPGMPPIVVTDPAPEGTRIDKDGVFANLYPGKGSGRRPGIVLLGGSEGGLGPGSARTAKALQTEGFTVLQLCYFGCPATPAQLANVPMETFDKGLAFLAALPDVDPARIGLVGGSKGAEAALLTASQHPEFKAVVVGMPSSVAWPGITFAATAQPGWTRAGQPVSFLPYAPLSAMSKGGIFAIYGEALPALPQHPEAVIPVELIKGRLMLVCGEADTLWPSCPMADQVSERLKAKGAPAATVLRYRDAGHAVFGPPLPAGHPAMASLGSLGGSPDGNNAARADDWPKAIAFLKAALKP